MRLNAKRNLDPSTIHIKNFRIFKVVAHTNKEQGEISKH